MVQLGLSKQKIDEIRRLYKEGIRTHIIAKRCNVSLSSVSDNVSPNRQKRVTNDDIELINKLYNSGHGHYAIHTNTGWCINTIKRYIKK